MLRDQFYNSCLGNPRLKLVVMDSAGHCNKV